MDEVVSLDRPLGVNVAGVLRGEPGLEAALAVSLEEADVAIIAQTHLGERFQEVGEPGRGAAPRLRDGPERADGDGLFTSQTNSR